MNPDYLSFPLFDIAEEVGIRLQPGIDEPLQDEQYEAFCGRYRSWAQQRDVLLREHLARGSQLFRVLLPYTNRAFGVAYQLQWYFDEMLIRDPVGVLLENQPGDHQLEDRKVRLRQLIQVLAQFLPALKAGHLLLYGQGARDEPPKIEGERLEELAAQPEIQKALMEAIRWGLEPRTAEDGREWLVFQAWLDTAGAFGWHTKALQGQATSPAIVVGETLRQVSRDEIERVLGADTVQRTKDLFPAEINGTLRNLAVASSMSATPLFDRLVDGLIIEAASNIPQGAFTQIGALNVALPYLEGVSPDALVQLRQDDPEAFAEFRLLMNDLVRRAQSGMLTEPLEQAAAREILPHLRKLEGEFEALKRTRRYAAVLGLAAIAGGVLAGVVLAPVAGAVAAVGVPAAASLLGSLEREGGLVSNPFYWLWRARR
jgi:hypothetical protein